MCLGNCLIQGSSASDLSLIHMVSQLLSSSMRFSQSSWADVKKIGRNTQCLVRHRLTMGPPLLPPHSIDNRSYTPMARDVGYHAVSKNSVIFFTRFEHAGHSFSHLLSFTGLRLLIECPWLSPDCSSRCISFRVFISGARKESLWLDCFLLRFALRDGMNQLVYLL